MGTFYEYQTQIGASETGLLGQCRPSGVLSILQEAATRAACEFHASAPEMLKKYHSLWMLSRVWYRLDRPLLWGDAVQIKTWHRANREAMLYRDFDLFVNGAAIGEAVSVWVLVDAASHKLLRLSTIGEVVGSGGGTLCKSRKLPRLKLPTDMSVTDTRRFRYSDTDSNGHVNNVYYADAAADAIKLEAKLPGHFVSSLQVDYLKECLAGETVDLSSGVFEEKHFICGTDKNGVNRFEACLTLECLPGKVTEPRQKIKEL